MNVSYLLFVLGDSEVADFFWLAAIFICPTYWLLRAFDGCGYKVGVYFPFFLIVFNLLL